MTPAERRAELPQPGEVVTRPGEPNTIVTACTGIVWPLDHEKPTRLEVHTAAGDTFLRVIPGRDGLGARFWIAERRVPAPVDPRDHWPVDHERGE